jgi:hypothetical protein
MSEISPSPSKRNRYVLFAGQNYYPDGGWYDMEGMSDDIDSLADAVKRLSDIDWWHIVDMDTMETVLISIHP